MVVARSVCDSVAEVDDGDRGIEASRNERQGNGCSSMWILQSPWTMAGGEVQRK